MWINYNKFTIVMESKLLAERHSEEEKNEDDKNKPQNYNSSI